MRGTIVNVSVKDDTGSISGDDLKRYKFSLQDWKDSINPAEGMAVDFETEDSLALEIHAIRGSSISTPGLKSTPEVDRIYKIPNQAVIGGVCAGAALKWGTNKTALRWIAAILTLFFWPLLIVYVIGWITLPIMPGTKLESSMSSIEASQNPKVNGWQENPKKLSKWAVAGWILLAAIIFLTVIGGNATT